MVLSCTGARLGSQCSFSCESNVELNGTHTTFCRRKCDSPYSQWDMDKHPFCQATEICQDLQAPKHGAIACDNWLGGRLCHPLCADGYSVVISNPLPALLVCLDDGTWLYHEQITDCYALDSTQGRPAVMSAEFYYTGDCNNLLVQNEIKLNFIITIQNSVSWNSKCQPTNCNIANIVVVCGETSRKRSTGNMKVDVEIYFGTENTTITSVEYEKEVLTVTELMFVIENEFSLENVTLVKANHTTYLLGISSNGLEIECPDNAVPVYGNIISCMPCPAGSYYDTVVSECIKCKRGSYQPTSGQRNCITCPERLITAKEGAIDSSECEESCVPGTWSTTGLPPCIKCDIGYYEESYGSVSCSKCPGNKITLMERRSNVSECFDFDIGFPNMSDVSYTDLEISTISFPFFITFHAKCDSNSSGTIFRLSSGLVVLLELDVNHVLFYNNTVQMPEDLCQGWVYIEIHVKHNFTIMYIDRKEIFKTLINFDVDEISGLNITLGGSGFSGYISQFNVRSLAANSTEGHTFPMCSSEDIEDGYVNWEDFSYSNLVNAYIRIPGQCDAIADCMSNPFIHGTCTDYEATDVSDKGDLLDQTVMLISTIVSLMYARIKLHVWTVFQLIRVCAVINIREGFVKFL
ncbi:signal peptide, CUB and EGF-like domain-containing protein 2 [Mytilus edulis]|uniref:signal peptide, CUB and EGF-like domain-containing protein 2 n=1 Tax=Mytilus edulis TaxID=6550 RepID=UPI0039EF08E6